MARETKAQKQERYEALLADGMSEAEAREKVWPSSDHPVSNGEWLAPVNDAGEMLVDAASGKPLDPDAIDVSYDDGVPTVTQKAEPEATE